MEARVVRIRPGAELGRFVPGRDGESLDSWQVASAPSPELAALRDVATYLRESDVPVAFPTETVYGLGADATRSAAVKGIYAAKGRPADNPLIVHVCDLAMLRGLLSTDPPSHIPPIYRPLIDRFWPGPLTILLPNPQPSPLAPEVTAGLATFGARMPASPLARTLIALAGRPLAAPSANASTRPSPTAARHVADDLAGRIELIVDGGPCGVGVESTVVDGLCDPPAVLRPGGVGLADLRAVPGWERVGNAYPGSNGTTDAETAPRAPGMKYKHYSPRARVVLYEAGGAAGCRVIPDDVRAALSIKRAVTRPVVGVIRTRQWPPAGGLHCVGLHPTADTAGYEVEVTTDAGTTACSVYEGELAEATVLDLGLGSDVRGVAQGLFSALRELDRRGADVIFVEGIEDRDDIAAAVMNRLRKAASEIK